MNIHCESFQTIYIFQRSQTFFVCLQLFSSPHESFPVDVVVLLSLLRYLVSTYLPPRLSRVIINNEIFICFRQNLASVRNVSNRRSNQLEVSYIFYYSDKISSVSINILVLFLKLQDLYTYKLT